MMIFKRQIMKRSIKKVKKEKELKQKEAINKWAREQEEADKRDNEYIINRKKKYETWP